MITAAHAAHPAVSPRRLCALFGINRAWYYRHRREDTAARAGATRLRDAIERVALAFPGYGYCRVTTALQRDGWDVDRKRILRVMRRESLLCQRKRRCVATTDSRHGCRPYPNLPRALAVDRLDRAWVADSTSSRLPTTFVYLACLRDAHARRCVGRHPARHIDTRLTLAALDQALATRRPAPGFIHHSDRGVQYASADYVARLAETGARISMAGVGNPYENAKAKRFVKTLQREEVYLKDDQTFAEAQTNLAQFIDDVYNTKRLHSSLGYQPPAEFEETYATSRKG
ncbi:MAG TPA: IS3 family transposase [Thermomicrobiales bacterium]|jgi:transposase InsO family protein